MRPRKTRQSGSGDLFRARLDQIINLKHELVRLAQKIDWEWIDAELADRFSDKGRPATETRFMAAHPQAHVRAVGRGRVRALGP